MPVPTGCYICICVIPLACPRRTQRRPAPPPIRSLSSHTLPRCPVEPPSPRGSTLWAAAAARSLPSLRRPAKTRKRPGSFVVTAASPGLGATPMRGRWSRSACGCRMRRVLWGGDRGPSETTRTTITLGRCDVSHRPFNTPPPVSLVNLLKQRPCPLPPALATEHRPRAQAWRLRPGAHAAPGMLCRRPTPPASPRRLSPCGCSPSHPPPHSHPTLRLLGSCPTQARLRRPGPQRRPRLDAPAPRLALRRLPAPRRT
jgi:hypothetical protein